jgi:protein N-terminal methyltransferase
MAGIPTIHRAPDVERGVQYWQGVPATVDGVLGGYGNGTLPIVDAQGSRTFLLQMLPRLSTNAPASSNQAPEIWLKEMITKRGGKGKSKSRALDCGAGVGRVSRDVLTRICDIVHIVEPVESVSNRNCV